MAEATTVDEGPHDLGEQTSESMPPIGAYIKKYGWIVGVAALVLVFLIMLMWYRSTRNELVDRGTVLSAEYQSNQNERSQYVTSIKEQLGIANIKSDKLDQVLTNAVEGRYDDAIVATPGQATPQNPLISAVVEAYPDLSGLNAYDKIMDAVRAGRESFKQRQNVLLDKIRQYDKYRQQGLFRPMLVSMVGYPGLEARIGTTVKTGKAALDQMKLIVTSSDNQQTFETGTEEPIVGG